jgi:hypothetical protein
VEPNVSIEEEESSLIISKKYGHNIAVKNTFPVWYATYMTGMLWYLLHVLVIWWFVHTVVIIPLMWVWFRVKFRKRINIMWQQKQELRQLPDDNNLSHD